MYLFGRCIDLASFYSVICCCLAFHYIVQVEICTLYFDIWNKNPHYIGISIELTYSQYSFEDMFMYFSSNDVHGINIIKQYLISSLMHALSITHA